MGLRSWWEGRQQARLGAYLASHPDTVLGALRESPQMAAAAVTAFYSQQLKEMEAQGVGDRKTAAWPILSQLGHGARYAIAQTLPKATPFNLRRFSEYPPSRRAINAICNPILGMEWKIEKQVPEGMNRKHLVLTPEDKLQIEIASRCLKQPNDDEGWRPFAEAVLEDVVVGGYGAIELVKTGKPLRPIALFPVDGQSIRINANWDGDPDEPRYAQALAYVGISVGTHEAVKLRNDELVYLKLNPRTNTPFGLGYLEVAFSAMNAWLGSFEYAERRASNATPNFGIHLGENFGPEQVRTFRTYWTDMIEGYGMVPILGGGKEPKVLDFRGTGTDELYLAWQELLLRIIAMAFGLSPMTLGIERDVNRSTAETQDVQDWDSISPIVGLLEYYITERFLWRALGYTDLEFKFVRKDADELRQIQINREKYETNIVTVDELRESYELDPLPGGIGQMTKAHYEAAAMAMAQPIEPYMGGPPSLDEEYRSQPSEPPLPIEETEEESPNLLTQTQAKLQAWRAQTNGHGKTWRDSVEEAQALLGRNGKHRDLVAP
mgnify:FL=1